MTIYLVDDDKDIRETLAWMLEAKGISLTSFAEAESFLSQANFHQPGVAIIDINMPGMDGLALQQALNQHNSVLAQIFLTGYATVPKAVQALQSGALDFLEKPVDVERLLQLIEQGQLDSQQRHQHLTELNAIDLKLAELTVRERQLMQLVVAGKTNKAIADELFIALRTVEIHRKNLFAKMNVNNAAELALLAGRHQHLL